jgi:type III restriction enzyme
MKSAKTLHQVLIEELGKRTIDQTKLPASITANLNPAFAMRPYQERGFRLFLSYWQEAFDGKQFKPRMVNDVFTDKSLNFMVDDGGDKEFGRSMNDAGETAYHLDLKSRAWFAFDDCFGTSEEKLLIQYIDKRYSDLAKVYSEAYLVRNEKHFKVYAFDDGRPLEPDFVLYLIGKEKTDTMHYQVFIEPKGSHLLKADEWKEKFLMAIKDTFEVEQLFSNRTHVVWGMPFYNSVDRMPEFDAAFDGLVK